MKLRWMYGCILFLPLLTLAAQQAPVSAPQDDTAKKPESVKKEEDTTKKPEVAKTEEGAAEKPAAVKTTIVVTATRDEVTAEKAPVSTSVVTSEETQTRNITSLDQSLNLLQGVNVLRFSQSGQMNQVTMRGFDTPGRTLVLLDGQPLNDGYTGGVTWTSLPVDEVDRIEVARGPFSSLYGGNAMGGVINVLTRPVEHREIELMSQRGSNSTTDWSARAADRFFNGRLGLSGSFQRYQTGGYPANFATASPASGGMGGMEAMRSLASMGGMGSTAIPVTGAIPTMSSTGSPSYIVGNDGNAWTWQDSWHVKGDYTFGKNTIVNMQYMRQQSAYGWGAPSTYLRDTNGAPVTQGPVLVNANGTPTQLNVTPSSFLATPGDSYSNWWNGSVQHDFGHEMVLRISGGLMTVPSSRYTTSGATATSDGGSGTSTENSNHTYWGEIQMNWRLSSRHNLVMGTETRQAEADDKQFNLSNWTNFDSRQGQSYEAHGQTINQAAYAQDQIRVTDALMLTAGVRYDYWQAYDGFSNGFSTTEPLTSYPERSNNSFSGKLSAVYSLPRSWTVHASVGNSFRAPDVLDLYQTFSLFGMTFNANPDLKPETMISGEIGIRKYVGKRFDVDTTYYHNHIKNLIYSVADSTGTNFLNENAGAANTDGIEFATHYHLVSWLQLMADYSYTEAVISSNPADPASVGKRVTNIPKHTFGGSLLASQGRWSGSLSSRYMGSTYSSDTNGDIVKGVYGSFGPFFQMDGSVGFRVNSHVQFIASAENLLNRTYYIYYLQPGRIVSGGLRFRL